MQLTGYQLMHLVHLISQDDEANVTLGLREPSVDEASGDILPGGLYGWFTEHPEEGCYWLPPDRETEALVAAL